MTTRMITPWLLALLMGCGASAMEVHARTAHAVRSGVSEAADQVDRLHKRDVLEAVDLAAEDGDDPEVAAIAADDAWLPVVEAQRSLARTVDTWVAAIVLAHAAGQDLPVGESMALAQQVLEQWSEMVQGAKVLGVDLPEPPSVLLTLVRTGSALMGDGK